jgi:hypothetical protein
MAAAAIFKAVVTSGIAFLTLIKSREPTCQISLESDEN